MRHPLLAEDYERAAGGRVIFAGGAIYTLEEMALMRELDDEGKRAVHRCKTIFSALGLELVSVDADRKDAARP